MSGPVWDGLPQTSQAAEHAGRTVATELLRGPSGLHGDCAFVVRMAGLDDARALAPKQKYAGFTRRARSYAGHKHVKFDMKVQAHRQENKNTTKWQRWLIRGNHAADLAAVAAKDAHPTCAASVIK